MEKVRNGVFCLGILESVKVECSMEEPMETSKYPVLPFFDLFQRRISSLTEIDLSWLLMAFNG